MQKRETTNRDVHKI